LGGGPTAALLAKSSPSHHRLPPYTMPFLFCLGRFEVDGLLPFVDANRFP